MTTKSNPVTPTLPFSHRRWKVVANDITGYDIIDDTGYLRATCTTLQDAIGDCLRQGNVAYRERLWSAIQGVAADGVTTGKLLEIARLIGIDPKTV